MSGPAELGHRRIDETVPFLASETNNPLQDQSECRGGSEMSQRTRSRLLVTLVAILLSLEIGGQLIPGPMTRLIETTVCDNYWRQQEPARLPPSDHLPQHLCKISAIQTEVAVIKGYSDFLEALLCAICAIPYGIWADRYGRRRALRLTVPGFVLNALITNSVLWFSDVLPLRAIWLASLSWIIGGGPTVAQLVVWTMLADLTTDDKRAALFFRVGLVTQIASFLASAISSPLMAINPWLPLLLGCGVISMGLGCIFSLPETMNKVKSPEVETPCSDDCEPSWPSESTYNLVSDKIARFIQPYRFLYTRSLLMLLFSFFTVQFSQNALAFLTLYASTRFGWSIARAHLLSSLYLAITIPLFLFVLPFLSNKALSHLTPPRRDLQIARFSIFAYILGSLALGFSSSVSLLIPSISIHAIGAGFPIVTRSLIASLVKREETARLYSVFEIMQTTGDILGSLCFTKAFSSSLRVGEEQAGLVWFLSSLLYGLVELVLMLVHV